MKKTENKKTKKSERALIIGRFQPAHLGHTYMIQEALRRYSYIHIVIGSSQEDYTLKNPLTGLERLEMMERMMRFLGVEKNKYKIHLAQDIATNSSWAGYVAEIVKNDFDSIFTASPFTELLFEDSGYKVDFHPTYKRRFYSGTEIRRRVAKGRDWSHLVPASSFVYLNKLGLDERIRRISASDNIYLCS